MRLFFTLLVVLVGIAGAGYVWFALSESTSTSAPTDTEQPANDQATTTPVASWETYQSPADAQHSFSLEYPPETTVRRVAEGIYEITYVRPRSEPNTEITDGYLATIQFVQAADPEAYAAESDIADVATPTDFVGYDAFRFQTESELSGELVTHYAFLPTQGSAVVADVSFVTYGDRAPTYEVEVFDILGTLSFNDAATDTSGTLIRVDTPARAETVTSPIQLSGEARGQWFFEANASVVVTDWDGRIIGESYITADEDWMTESFVPFSGTVSYELPEESYSASGTVIFQRANPSGLPENDAAVEIPVLLE